MANSRFRCAQCKQYGEVDSVFRTAGLARLCSTECYSAYLDEQRKKRHRNAERSKKKAVKTKRSAPPKIPGDVRMAVRERDKACRWCGAAGTQTHHVAYRSEGGPDVETNLVLLCNGCHARAHSSKVAYQPVLLKYLELVTAEERTLLTIPQVARLMLLEGTLPELAVGYFGFEARAAS